MDDMLQALSTYVKLAVDVKRGILQVAERCTQTVRRF